MQHRKIRHIALLTAGFLLALGSIAFVGKKTGEKVCASIVVDIDNQLNNYFLNERDIIRWITNGGDDRVVGEKMHRINAARLEKTLRAHQYVRDAQIFKDLSGNLIVQVDQMRPIARLMGSRSVDRYISEQGEIMPVSDRYTARVVLIHGWPSGTEEHRHLTQIEGGSDLLRMLHYIRTDPFWHAQVAEMVIDRNMNITMYTQVSKQKIEFGRPEQLEDKFRKLKIFYKEILPARGWNTYESVNLKYRNQIICE
jgi:cell division protein FtsQ